MNSGGRLRVWESIFSVPLAVGKMIAWLLLPHDRHAAVWFGEIEIRKVLP